MAAVRDTWRALWISRLLVWVAGVGTVATLGFGPIRGAFDPPGVTRGFGWLGDLLAAPAARWDSAWYLVIAHYGYRPELGSYTSARDAFFPLYPLGLHALSDLGLQAVLAGVLFSLAAFAVALYCLHRLTTLELAGSGRPGSAEVAGLAVLVTALAPMAFYFSAVYSESLFLALSVGLFLCARRGRWAWAGVLGMLAVATRSTGLVLALPALMLYLYGPRADRPPDFDRARSSRARSSGVSFDGESLHANGSLRRRLRAARPRYRLRADILWLVLLPAGLGLYMGYLGLVGRRHAGAVSRSGHLGAAFRGTLRRRLGWRARGVRGRPPAAVGTARPRLLPGRRRQPVRRRRTQPACCSRSCSLAVPLFVLALRVLPLAYGAYAIAALALPLSYPVPAQPLMSLPRFLVVLFPLSMALAVWLAAHPRARIPTLATSALLMAFFVAQFATWHWVA